MKKFVSILLFVFLSIISSVCVFAYDVEPLSISYNRGINYYLYHGMGVRGFARDYNSYTYQMCEYKASKGELLVYYTNSSPSFFKNGNYGDFYRCDILPNGWSVDKYTLGDDGFFTLLNSSSSFNFYINFAQVPKNVPFLPANNVLDSTVLCYTSFDLIWDNIVFFSKGVNFYPNSQELPKLVREMQGVMTQGLLIPSLEDYLIFLVPFGIGLLALLTALPVFLRVLRRFLV